MTIWRPILGNPLPTVVGGVILFCVTLIAPGCATLDQLGLSKGEGGTKKTTQSTKADDPVATFFEKLFPKKERAKIIGVKARANEEAAIVEIKTTKEVKYVTYRFHNPERLAVEIRGVDNRIAGDVHVQKNRLVSKIEFQDFTPRADAVRAEITISEPFVFEVDQHGDTISITLLPDESEVILAYRKKLQEAEKRIAWLEYQLARMKGIASAEGSAEDTVVGTPDDDAALGAGVADLEAMRKMDESASTPPMVKDDIRVTKITNMLNGWMAAWKSKDVGRYGAYYHSRYRKNGAERDRWLAAKQNNFNQAGTITISVDNLAIAFDKSVATVTFNQKYHSDPLSDYGKKTLILEEENGGYKIVEENWTRLP